MNRRGAIRVFLGHLLLWGTFVNRPLTDVDIAKNIAPLFHGIVTSSTYLSRQVDTGSETDCARPASYP
jgi:hypothetical protein